MGSNNHRGEISQISDDVFINYSLNLPDEELASTSGYFMKDVGNPPLRYSHFTVQRGATSSSVQTTTVHQIDPVTGTKLDPLATIQWSSNRAKDICLGLIIGYEPPSALPPEWVELAPPYYPCYVSMASVSLPGMGDSHTTGKPDIHANRITESPSAILTINLPSGVSTGNLKPFLYRHKHAHGGAAPGTPEPEEITNTVQLLPNQIVIGAPGEVLPMGLYVVAMPALETATANSTSPVQTPYHHEETSETVVAV